MRNYTILTALLATLSLSGVTGKAATDEALARMDGDIIGRFHFVGTERIAADPHAVGLNGLGALPATAELRDKTLDKLATTPFRLFQQKLANHNTNDFAPLIRPLLDDLLRNESYAEMRGPTNAVPELMLAVHLGNDRAILWQSYLSTVLSSWTGIRVQPIKGDGFTGWELRKHHDPNLIRFLRVGDWVLFGWGWDELKLQPSFLQRIKNTKRPVEVAKNDWLDVLVDWPSYLAHHPITLPSPLPAKLPKMHLTVQGRKEVSLQGEKDYVRPKLTMLFPEPLGLMLEPWRIPTNTIHNPMVSFTVARGIAPWLSAIPAVKALHPSSVPNQLCIWAMGQVPYETSVTAPMTGASNYVAELEPRLVAILNAFLKVHPAPALTEAVWMNNRVLVKGLPVVTPDLHGMREPAGDFLMGGLFPAAFRSNAPPFPKELLREILSKPNLVYYDWEMNKERIDQWRSLEQVYLVSAGRPMPGIGLPGQKWLQAAKGKMINCGTEVTLTAPNELTLLRNAPVGLTGFELNLLEYWLDAPEFPLHVKYPPPTRPMLRKP